jgi:alkylated DNA repair protein alkB family protein 8
METSTESETNFEITHVKNIYNQIAHSFDNTRGRNYWNAVNYFIQKILDKPLKILDLGCGNGKYIPLFKPSNQIIGLDNSTELLKIVSSRYPHVQTYNSDVTSTNLESNSFDHIISIAVIHHLHTEERRIQMIQEIYRLLKVEGTGFITAWATTALSNKFINIPGCSSCYDYLVPWDNNFNRFYHLFQSNEFEELVEKAGLDEKLSITFKIFECDNYAIEIKKLC